MRWRNLEPGLTIAIAKTNPKTAPVMKKTKKQEASIHPFAISCIIMVVITVIAVAANAQAPQQIDPSTLLVQQVVDGELAFIEGSIFDDANGDCLHGGNEQGLKGWYVVASHRGTATYAKTDAEGNFTFTVAPGRYSISLMDDQPAHTYSECSSEVQKVAAGKANKVTRIAFAVQQSALVSETAVSAAN